MLFSLVYILTKQNKIPPPASMEPAGSCTSSEVLVPAPGAWGAPPQVGVPSFPAGTSQAWQRAGILPWGSLPGLLKPRLAEMVLRGGSSWFLLPEAAVLHVSQGDQILKNIVSYT